MKTVTVIIATYNRWPIVCSAIDSVLEQTYRQTDCLVVDDASTDDTAALIKDKYGNKVSVVLLKTNQGQSASRNSGAESCDSDGLCFLDSDDILDHDAIEKRVSLFNENRDDVKVSFGLVRTPRMKRHNLLDHKKRGDKLILEEYLRDNSWCHNSGFLINREIFLSDGMYDKRLRHKEDIELLLRLLYKHPFFYCGAEIGQVRDVCGENRERNNYEKIVRQGSLFSSVVLNNALLEGVIGRSDVQEFICSDIEEELRALYKLGRYAEFRSFYKTAVRDAHILNTRRFFKRFLLSYVKGLFSVL
jgi:glycosyltransferase involved in cell wall biosynthesis